MIALLEKCLTKGADIEAKNKYGETAFHQACSRLNETGITWLLEKKAKLNCTNQYVAPPRLPARLVLASDLKFRTSPRALYAALAISYVISFAACTASHTYARN